MFRDGEELTFDLELRGYRAEPREVHEFVEREGLVQMGAGFSGSTGGDDAPS